MTDWPITIVEAAARLHCSERWLRGHLAAHPCGRKAGRRIVFNEADFEALVNSLPKVGLRIEAVDEVGLTPPAVTRKLRMLLDTAKARGRRRR